MAIRHKEYYLQFDSVVAAEAIRQLGDQRGVSEVFRDATISILMKSREESIDKSELVSVLGEPDIKRKVGVGTVWEYQWVDYRGSKKYSSSTPFLINKNGTIVGLAEDWINSSIPVERIHFDVVFCISKDFFYGDARSVDEGRYEQMLEQIVQPNLPLIQPSRLATKDAIGRESELIKYYQDVFRLAKKHSSTEIESYFWLKPLICSPPSIYIDFLWHDTLVETETVIDSLLGAKEGFLLDDADQGWEISIHAYNKSFFLLCRDPDNDEERCNISFLREPFIREVKEASERLDAVMRVLDEEFGLHYWS